MKVIALVILVVGSSSGLGSGPYLPSGWKPAGPAFYLPTETEKPVAIPLKDVAVQESESSGSSFLREYGPPKVQVEESGNAQVQVESETSSSDALREYGSPRILEVSQDITQQALPDTVTEQAFVIIDTTFVSQNLENADIAQEVVTEQTTSDAETTTELQNNDETTQSEALIEGRTEVESQTESSLAAEEKTTEKLVEVAEVQKKDEVTEINQEIQAEKVTQEAEAVKLNKEVEVAQTEITKESENAAAIEQKVEEVAEVRAVEAGVKNIAEALVNLENEIKAQQVQTNEEVPELRTIVQGSTQSSPEGFLEYGPPGFTEYGPPKGDLKVVPAENPVVGNDINATRRRRFSPKFRSYRRNN